MSLRTSSKRPHQHTIRRLLEKLEQKVVPASISGIVWKDSLGGGTQNGGEAALLNVSVHLYQDGGNGTFDNGGGDDIDFGVQASSVFPYAFGGLLAGKYFVDIDQAAPVLTGLKMTTGSDPRVYTLGDFDDITNADFGFQRNPPPTPQVQGGALASSAYPTKVSGAIVNILPLPGSVLGGANSDNLKVNFVASGPLPWTESRHNEGDISFSLGVANPGNASSYPADAFVNNYQPNAASNDPTTFAWRVSRETALSFASVHANGFDNGDVLSGGGSVGTMYGVAYFNTDSSGGVGYSQVDGVFGGGNNAQDLQMGLVGSPDEGSLNVGIANFPFQQGWVGGFVDDITDANSLALFDGGFATPGLDPTTAVQWQTLSVGQAKVDLSGFNSRYTPANGMLFVSANAGNDNNTEIANALPSGNGWNVVVRADNDIDTTGNTLSSFNDSEFQFMYVDFAYKNAIAGHIQGTTGNKLQTAGGYTLTRLSTGTYALSIPGKNDSSGTLLLGAAGAMAGDPTLPDRSFLSYQYDQANNRFVINVRELTSGANPFGQDSPLKDGDFNFAWVDFTTPMEPTIALPTAVTPQVNGGAVQRSIVKTVTVTFSEPVTFPSGAAAAFTLTRTGTGGTVGNVNLAFAQSGNDVTITFVGGGAVGVDAINSLINGKYTLRLNASNIQGVGGTFDGDGDGIAEGSTADDVTFDFHRQAGDSDGDADVDNADFIMFRTAFGAGPSAVFDFDGDGDVDNADFTVFRNNFGVMP